MFCDFENIEVVNYHKQHINDHFKTIFASNYLTDKLMLKMSESALAISLKIYCRIKPVLSDDYPCVLSEMNIQYRDLMKNEDFDYDENVILLVETFSSIHTSKEQLIKIFDMSAIHVFFIDELLYHCS